MLIYIDNLNAGNSTTYDPMTRSKSTGAWGEYVHRLPNIGVDEGAGSFTDTSGSVVSMGIVARYL
jgi:hypothetical protein